MEKFIIMGGNCLNGEITLQAAKNAILPLMSCCILCAQEVTLRNCPPITDVKKMAEIIERMGGSVQFVGDDIKICCAAIEPLAVDEELTKSIRSSIFMLGSMLGRFKRAEISYPGGCEIGKRPIDIHIAGLKELGVDINEMPECIECVGEKLHSGKVKLSFPSVGATENMIMVATLTKGKTVIENAAREPEIVDLERFINAMGGCVEGAGTSVITVKGVEKLHGVTFTPISDRIAAGTYLTMCAACGGDVTVRGCCSEDLKSVTEALKICGCRIEENDRSIRLVSSGNLSSVPLLRTGPFPAFPTDMQPQFCALLATAGGTSLIEETVFENRFKYVGQLENMGADIALQGRRALVTGVRGLHASIVSAEDLRGGAALITAALRADGVSTVYGTKYIDRGYYRIEEILTSLGADIVRVSC